MLAGYPSSSIYWYDSRDRFEIPTPGVTSLEIGEHLEELYVITSAKFSHEDGEDENAGSLHKLTCVKSLHGNG